MNAAATKILPMRERSPASRDADTADCDKDEKTFELGLPADAADEEEVDHGVGCVAVAIKKPLPCNRGTQRLAFLHAATKMPVG